MTQPARLCHGRRLRRSGFAFAVVVVAFAVFAPASLESARHRVVNSTTFTDPGADSATAADIGTTTVRNDDLGTLTFAVALANRPTQLNPNDVVDIVIDADGAPHTGDQGFEYLLQYDTVDGAFLFHWQEGDYQDTGSRSTRATFANGVLTFSVSFRELSDTGMLNFYVESFLDPDTAGQVDFAPDGTAAELYSYRVKIPLLLDSVDRPPKVKAGKAVDVDLTLTTDDEKPATVRCSARLAGKPVAGSPGGWLAITVFPPKSSTGDIYPPFAYKGFAVCSWKPSKQSKGKTLTGTMTVTKEGLTVRQAFAVKIT